MMKHISTWLRQPQNSADRLSARMTQSEHQALNALLRMRSFETPSDDLVHRIIAQAAFAPRTQHTTYTRPTFSALGDILMSYLTPAPAFACVCLLLLGIIVGRDLGTTSTIQELTQTSSPSAYVTADNINYQDWGSL